VSQARKKRRGPYTEMCRGNGGKSYMAIEGALHFDIIE
jgi:hypothetical protein